MVVVANRGISCAYRVSGAYRTGTFGLGLVALVCAFVIFHSYDGVAELRRLRALFGHSPIESFAQTAGTLLIVLTIIFFLYIPIKNSLFPTHVGGQLTEVDAAESRPSNKRIRVRLDDAELQVRFDAELLTCLKSLVHRNVRLSIGALGTVLEVKCE